MQLPDHLRRACQARPDHIAIVAGDRRWTYRQLDCATDRVAASLASLGIGRGDRVALQLANSPELVLAYYACFKLGAIAVPINNRFAAPELEYTLNHSASRVCISQTNLFANLAPIRTSLRTVEHFFLIDTIAPTNGARSFAELLEPAVEKCDFPALADDDVAAILYTSGTTSRPKGVTHTHRSLDSTCELYGTLIDLGSDDVVCLIPPLCHILGFATQLLATIWAGATLVLLPSPDPQVVLRTIEQHQGTRIAALPVLLQALVNFPGNRGFRLDSLRTICAGGDAVPVALQEKFFEIFGVPVLEGCGMTEVIPFTLNLHNQRRLGSIGRACPGMTIRLVDDAGRDVPPGATGEILVSSQAAMIGYWQEPELTAATLAGGYVHTGDLGRLDEDGYYWFMGRKKEIIIRAGSNISPLEVEEILYQHPAVRECGVVGVPDGDLGEAVWAYVALSNASTITATELLDFAKSRIASYKVPERVHFLPDLPKGPTGKVHRRSLRDQAIRERSAVASQQSR